MCLSSFHVRVNFLFGKRTKIVNHFKMVYWILHPVFSKILLFLIIKACCKSESSLSWTLYSGLLLYPHCLSLTAGTSGDWRRLSSIIHFGIWVNQGTCSLSNWALLALNVLAHWTIICSPVGVWRDVAAWEILNSAQDASLYPVFK